MRLAQHQHQRKGPKHAKRIGPRRCPAGRPRPTSPAPPRPTTITATRRLLPGTALALGAALAATLVTILALCGVAP